MPSTSKRKPQLCHHKPSGKAYVRLKGKHGPSTYLGEYGSQEAQDEYDRLIRKWKATHDTDGSRKYYTTVGELFAEFISYADAYYVRPDGTPTGEATNYRHSCKLLLDQFKYLPAADFDLMKLESVRDAMIAKGWVRTSINQHIWRIRRVFKWGVRRKIGTAEMLAEIQLIEPLQPGRLHAKESDPVLPVPLADIEATLPKLTAPLRAMVELYLLSGARVSELRLMKAGDVDRSRDLWEYWPKQHKNSHRGKVRVIFFDADAQEILLPFLLRPADAYLFNPEEGRRSFVTSAYREGAVVSVRNAKAQENRPYTLAGIESSIKRACKAVGVTPWSPGQLRHNAATDINREEGDIDASRVVLGQSTKTTTERYVELDLERAREVMRRRASRKRLG